MKSTKKEMVFELRNCISEENKNLLRELELRKSNSSIRTFSVFYLLIIALFIFIEIDLRIFIITVSLWPILYLKAFHNRNEINKLKNLRAPGEGTDEFRQVIKSKARIQVIIEDLGYGDVDFDANDKSDKNESVTKYLIKMRNEKNVIISFLKSNANILEKVIKDYERDTGDKLYGFDYYDYEINKAKNIQRNPIKCPMYQELS